MSVVTDDAGASGVKGASGEASSCRAATSAASIEVDAFRETSLFGEEPWASKALETSHVQHRRRPASDSSPRYRRSRSRSPPPRANPAGATCAFGSHDNMVGVGPKPVREAAQPSHRE